MQPQEVGTDPRPRQRGAGERCICKPSQLSVDSCSTSENAPRTFCLHDEAGAGKTQSPSPGAGALLDLKDLKTQNVATCEVGLRRLRSVRRSNGTG
ncbi:hypothetical protein Y1Q_0014911 [Alligator mississippiensis]|uniref:Uncharacterized protein n=1 Tax=Alligator mississippiensis TaxID=8496 RepID=A0A151N8M4_ALLMI|nr:hypothetical protein Y1Q_0014911 [Alligator mississippiensis]